MKAYEKLGLTSSEVVEMQRWLFDTMDQSKTVSEMITKTAEKFTGVMQHYALYILGNSIGTAQTKEQFGMQHILDPEVV